MKRIFAKTAFVVFFVGLVAFVGSAMAVEATATQSAPTAAPAIGDQQSAPASEQAKPAKKAKKSKKAKKEAAIK